MKHVLGWQDYHCTFCRGPMQRTRAGFDAHQMSAWHKLMVRIWDVNHPGTTAQKRAGLRNPEEAKVSGVVR